MKNLLKNILLITAVMFFAGCGVYEPIEVIPDHIQTVRIQPIRNETQQIELTSDLKEEVINEFIKEGRLTVVSNEDSDSVLDITILDYSKMPIDYDENFVAQEYKLTMIINLKFYDNINQVKLWEDVRNDLTGGIEAWVTYFVGTDTEFAETEEEARTRLIQDVSKKILHRTVYGWD
jgi:outer membrane lipopolysaccharide assembly protein LptE/RlpB